MVSSRCSPAVRADRAIRPEVAAGLMTLVPAARDQRLRNRCAAALAWRLLKGKVTRRGTDGEPEPGSGRRERTGERRTRGRRAKGRTPAGKREAGGKSAEGNRRTRGEAPDLPGESPGIRGRTHLRWRWVLAGCANCAWPPASFLAGHAVWQSNPGHFAPPRASASILCGLLIAVDSIVMLCSPNVSGRVLLVSRGPG